MPAKHGKLCQRRGVAIVNQCAIVNLVRIVNLLRRSIFSTAGSFVWVLLLLSIYFPEITVSVTVSKFMNSFNTITVTVLASTVTPSFPIGPQVPS